MYKLANMIADIDNDTSKDAALQRWTVGYITSPISGALWLPRDVKLPCKITIKFFNKPTSSNRIQIGKTK